MLMLDTCTLLWLASRQEDLSATARAAIRDSSGGLYVSAISAFEIAIKSKKGALALPMPADAWFTRALSHHGIAEISVDARLFGEAVRLPDHHNDPADRIIIATALAFSMRIVTPDPLFGRYSSVITVW